jgi:hypothetical protein
MKYFIMSYNSGFCLVNVQALAVYFTNASSKLVQEGILGKHKEEIGNLNGFEKIRPWARGLRVMQLKTIGRGWGGHPWWAQPLFVMIK